jgi:hypothetical protein
MTDDMTFIDVEIAPVMAGLGGATSDSLELTVAGAGIRVTATTDLALLARVVRALAETQA